MARHGTGKVGFKSIVLYWISVFDANPPSYELDYTPTPQTGSSWLKITNAKDAKTALAILASKLASEIWGIVRFVYFVIAIVVVLKSVRQNLPSSSPPRHSYKSCRSASMFARNHAVSCLPRPPSTARLS